VDAEVFMLELLIFLVVIHFMLELLIFLVVIYIYISFISLDDLR
jgi:hypothetical protein